jgi:hypothetical protein
MKAIKKAKNGTTTAKTTIRPGATKDSTAYFNRAEKSFMNMANSEFKKGNEAVSDKMVKLAKNAFENKQRQKLKGKPGYDKNGYPLKPKAKSGATISKAKDGKWMQKVSASIKRRGTAGKCTPITKPGCTGKAKALAKTFKKIAAKRKSK